MSWGRGEGSRVRGAGMSRTTCRAGARVTRAAFGVSLNAMTPPPISDRPLRLDVWLDVACLSKTRSEAQRAIKGGKIEVNGEKPKTNRDVKPGDTLTLTRPLGRKQVVRVLGTCEQHLPKAEARALLFEDITPLPTPEERAFLQLLKDTRPRGPAVAPDKRDRRELRRLKGKE